MQNDLIESCKKYMLCGEGKNSMAYPVTPHIYLTNEVRESSPQKNSFKKNIIIPPLEENTMILSKNVVRGSHPIDSLFWCFFIILNGRHEYEINSSFKREKEFKIQSIEKLRNIKSELKAFKLRLNEIEDELLNQTKISIKTLFALCLLHKINILYVWNRKYFEIINNADENINVILNENKEDKIIYDMDLEKINYYRENYLCIENINKQIKSITGYTHKELLAIAHKLDIQDITSKKTKKEIYEKIIKFGHVT